ncbi:hypothetical protein CMI37_16260 [Candidatus Pacearchaeota archaeon]|jgi:hypothetical protein|nr:hypothetical protein [Candidatus Pacearchaeota archaeon]|tara:strand:+ start:2285 stop:2608 length:324 start_codon:yes stop_codon:yes gene_type:complete
MLLKKIVVLVLVALVAGAVVGCSENHAWRMANGTYESYTRITGGLGEHSGKSAIGNKGAVMGVVKDEIKILPQTEASPGTLTPRVEVVVPTGGQPSGNRRVKRSTTQ